MRNQRGEVATATIIAIAAAALVVGLLTGSRANPFSIFQKSAANKKGSFTKQYETHTPVLLQSKDGKMVAVGTKVENTYETGMDEGPIVLTYGQRVAKFFAGLTNISLFGILIGLIFFPAATITAMWRWGKKYKDTLRTTVQGIRDAPPEAAAQVKVSLASAQDKKHKIVIDEIKKDLH